MPAKNSNPFLPRPITIHDFGHITTTLTNQHGVIDLSGQPGNKQAFTILPIHIRRMSERRQCQRTLPPIKKSMPRRGEKERDVSSRRESINIQEAHSKIKADPGRHQEPLSKIKPDHGRHQQSFVTTTSAIGSALGDPLISSVGKRRSLPRQESLPESLTSGCYRPLPEIRSKPEKQKQNTDGQKAIFNNMPFRLSIASEYDLNSNKGPAETSNKHTQFFRCKKLGGDLSLDEGNLRQFNMPRRGSYSRNGDLSSVTDSSTTRQPPEPLSPRSLYEMQLRYKNLIKLDRQIKFKNSQVLRGEKIRQRYTLPGIRTPIHSDFVNAGRTGNLELLAVLSVKQANETENRERREALKDDNQRILITQALQLGAAQCPKSKTSWRGDKGCQDAPQQPNNPGVSRPSALVTISGGSGNLLHKSIKITLPDCKLRGSTTEWGKQSHSPLSEDGNETEIFQLDLDEEDIVALDESFADFRQTAQTPEMTRREVPYVAREHLNDLSIAQDTDVLTRREVSYVAGEHSNDLSITQDNDGFTDDSFSEVLLDNEFPEERQISEVDVSDDDESDTDDQAIHPNDEVYIDIKGPGWLSRSSGTPRSIEASCRSPWPSSHSVNVRDFLAVPVSNVTRCVEVLSLGSVAGSGSMDIPEIRMICATPLPPGSPEF